MQILKPKQKSVPISEYNRLKKTLQDELKRKDKQIQALKKRIEILMNSAVRESSKVSEIGVHARKLLEINKKLKERLDKEPQT